MKINNKPKITEFAWYDSIHRPTKKTIYHCYYPKLRYNKFNIKTEANSALCQYSLSIKDDYNNYLRVSEIKTVGFSEDKACSKCLNILKLRNKL